MIAGRIAACRYCSSYIRYGFQDRAFPCCECIQNLRFAIQNTEHRLRGDCVITTKLEFSGNRKRSSRF